MRLGYNTNGFAHHPLDEALRVLAHLGYQSVALTLDYHALNPFSANLSEEIEKIRAVLTKNNMRCVIETGARFLLDPMRKHFPTLVSGTQTERARRLEFLRASVRIAAELNADAVSFWSGASGDDHAEQVHFDHLVEGIHALCADADEHDVRLAFEPEPGMMIDTMGKFAELHGAVNHPRLGLTMDVGHLHCQREEPISDYIYLWRDWLWNIHIEDMKRDVHDHLMFGEGDIHFCADHDCVAQD